MDSLKLKKKIRSEFNSQKEFADTINWHPNKVSKMLTGKYIPNVDEVALITSTLNLALSEHWDIFLNNLSPNGDKFS